jgi:hypothetical protein
MEMKRLAASTLAAIVAISGIGSILWMQHQPGAVDAVELTDTDERAIRRQDDEGPVLQVVDDDTRGDGDSTKGDDGTSGGDNTGDGDRTAGDDGTSGGNNTGDGDATAGNDGTSGGNNTGDGDGTAGNDGTSGGDNTGDTGDDTGGTGGDDTDD